MDVKRMTMFAPGACCGGAHAQEAEVVEAKCGDALCDAGGLGAEVGVPDGAQCLGHEWAAGELGAVGVIENALCSVHAKAGDGVGVAQHGKEGFGGACVGA